MPGSSGRKSRGLPGINAAIFGGNWNNGANAGSRSSNWNNAASNSNNNIGLRCACDRYFPLCRCHGAAGRPRSYVVSRWGPPSGNTFLGLAERGVPRMGNARPAFMSARHKHLMDFITDMDNLRRAYFRTTQRKRMTWGYLNFKEYDQLHLKEIQTELREGCYQIGPYREFTIFEPKPRLISALGFKDRLVQHAVCNVIGPIFEKSLLPYTFACRPGLGTHAGVRHIQAQLRKTQATHFLKTDFRKFFPSIQHAVLHQMIERKISCLKTLKVLREIIPMEGQGLPIGSLTSQLFANVYGGAVDRYLHFELKERHWARYMDDIIVLGHDPEALRETFTRLSEYAQYRLGLHISKWHVANTTRGINFLGYRIWATHKLLRKDSVTRAKRKIQNALKHQDMEALRRFIAAWSGHARWADTHHLLDYLETHYELGHHHH